MVIITNINNIIIESFFVEIDIVGSFNHNMVGAYKYLFGIDKSIVKYIINMTK